MDGRMDPLGSISIIQRNILLKMAGFSDGGTLLFMFIHGGWESLGCICAGWGIVYGWIKNGRKQLNIVKRMW